MAERNSVLRKYYVFADGTTRRSAKEGFTAIRFEVLNGKDGEGKAIVAETIDFDPSATSEAVRQCAMGHGFSQKIGDEVAGAPAKAEKAGETFGPAFVASLINDAMDNLRNGVWVEEGEGSSGAGNVTILFEAVKAAFEAAKKPIAEERLPELMKKLADKGERDKFKANPQVAAHLARITAERAAERAKKARDAAKAGDAAGLEALGEI